MRLVDDEQTVVVHRAAQSSQQTDTLSNVEAHLVGKHDVVTATFFLGTFERDIRILQGIHAVATDIAQMNQT